MQVTRTIRLPLALAEALDQEAERRKTSTADLIRSRLADHGNEDRILTAIEAAKKEILADLKNLGAEG